MNREDSGILKDSGILIEFISRIITPLNQDERKAIETALDNCIKRDCKNLKLSIFKDELLSVIGDSNPEFKAFVDSELSKYVNESKKFF